MLAGQEEPTAPTSLHVVLASIWSPGGTVAATNHGQHRPLVSQMSTVALALDLHPVLE